MTPAESLAKKLKDGKAPRGDNAGARCQPKHLCNIKELRETLGLTQRDVANAVGSSGPVIHCAEHGHEIYLSLALKLAKFFGLSVEEIWQPLPEPK